MVQSNSKQPDLDWSQVKETVKLLTVSVTQVECSMKEGDSSVNTLTASFTALVEQMNSINELLSALDSSQAQQEALACCSKTSEKIQSSIIAFQFYDRLQQSLSHVVEGLKGLAELVESPERLYNPNEWVNFQQQIRARYTMESEKVMFDAIVAGKSIDDAVNMVTNIDEKIESDDDIELF